MTDSNEKQKMASLEPELHKFDAIINQSSVIEEGTPVRYHLRTESHQSEPYRKMTFGERDKNKPHKAILMVGETGAGKTKLINTMINHMLDVQREDKVWFEITDDQSENRSSFHSQTSRITVYEFYSQESPIHLTIIDTPGFGDTHGIKKDKEIAESLLNLSECDDCIHKLDAVCLVINATQNRLSDRQIYIFDAIQSLFGCNIDENVVLLLTYSRGAHPKYALMAVKEAKIKCALNDENQPVYFQFDNCQGETFHKEYQMVQEQSWNLSSRAIKEFFKFLDNTKPKHLKMTQDVLKQRKQLEANISQIKQFKKLDQKQNELQQAQDALEKNKKDVEENTIFEYEVEVKYKEKVDIDRSVASVATCCSVCEENCHYPGCWWISDLSWCEVMKNNHCTVCTNKCHYSKHVKEAKIYVTKTKKEKRTNEDLKKKYKDNLIKVTEGVSLVKNLEEELQELQIGKVKLVMETFHCVEILERIALNTESMIILLHVDFLIEKMNEINEPEKAKILENIKKRAGEEKHNALGYITEINSVKHIQEDAL